MEEYIEYWGLEEHPFQLAPDSRMMCVSGQHYECLERVRYAINTGKGGVLIVSEDAGLGKTTLLLKLVEEMKETYGSAFRYAFIDHPTLSSSQIIARIAADISGLPVGEDKLKNLDILRDALIQAKEQGGRSIIIVDEGQLLCEAPEILQELRILINLTHNNQYLHTFILSGQRTLWHTIKNMPEFWQRLPVRYYFVPLKVDETKDIVQYRLRRAGAEEGREIFTEDALEIIHRYARGSPRTVIALADLSLLVGYTNRAGKIGFKEVSKAIQAMSGQGESLPYMREENRQERGASLGAVSWVERSAEFPRRTSDYSPAGLKTTPVVDSVRRMVYPRPVFIVVLAVVLGVLLGIGGYRYFSDRPAASGGQVTEPVKRDIPAKALPDRTSEPTDVKEPQPPSEGPRKAAPQEAAPATKAASLPKERVAVVTAEAGNVREAPDVNAPRIGVIFRDETIRILDEKPDRGGAKWYKVILYGNREGWISERVLEMRPSAEPAG